MQFKWGLAIPLTFFCVLTVPALQHGSGESAAAATDRGWSELTSTMEKMHRAMSSVTPSGGTDVDFVQLMLPHHQAAIDMAKSELLLGKSPEMRRLAQEIITDQQSEIDLMQLWLKKHVQGQQKSRQSSESSITED